MGEVILESLRRDLRRQSMREWLGRVAEQTKDIPKISRPEMQAIIEESDREIWGDDDDGA